MSLTSRELQTTERFHSRGKHLCKFIGTKESVLHKKRVQLPKDFLGTPTWPPFRCFRTPIWPPWRHVKTLYIRAFLFFSEKLELRIWRRQNSSFNRVFSQVRQSQVKNAHRRTYKKRKIYIYLISLYMKTFLKMGVYIYIYNYLQLLTFLHLNCQFLLTFLFFTVKEAFGWWIPGDIYLVFWKPGY